MPEDKQHGGGPKTPEGKERSSENATTHGMCAKRFRLLADESEEAYEQHEAEWRAQFEPQDFLETQLVDQVILNSWLMRRANRRYMDAEAEGDEHRTQLMQRYKTTAERAFYRSLEAVRRLRKDNVRYEGQIVKMAREHAKHNLEMAKLQREVEKHRKKLEDRSEKSEERSEKSEDRSEKSEERSEVGDGAVGGLQELARYSVDRALLGEGRSTEQDIPVSDA